MPKYNTKQRKSLLSYLERHTDERLSAKQIANDLKGEGISLSAVYRNITELEAEGKLKRHSKGGSREVYYQYIDSDDCKECVHMSCKGCGKTYHMHTPDARILLDSIARLEHFDIDMSDTVIYGTCETCKKGYDA